MKKDYLFYLSCILSVTSIVLFHINQILAGLGIYLFIISIVLLIFSKKKMKRKLIFIVLFLFIGAIGIISGIIFQGGKANDEFNISENVNGRFRVIFTRNCGEIPRQEKNWYIINVNSNIQFFKRPIESVFYRQRFCLVDNQGKKTWLKEIKSIEEFDGNPSIIVINPQYWKDKKVNINDFIIIKDKGTILKNESYLDSLSYEVLLNCK